MSTPRRSYLPWWLLPAAITLLLLVFNSPWWRMYNGPTYRAYQPDFGLFVEMNFAVWWSSVLYLLSALLFYEIATGEDQRRRRAYRQLAVLMLAVVIDEIGALHEWVSGLGGWLALAPFALVGVLLLGDSLRLLWRRRDSRRVGWLVLAGFALFASVALQEYAEHNLTSLQFTRRYGRFYEEATELLAAWVLLGAAVYRRQGFRLRGGLAAVVPDPRKMTALTPILVVGLGLHLVAAQARVIQVGTWDGEPAAVYPAVVFFLLACYAFWIPRHRAADSAASLEVRGFWHAAGLLFLLCSLGGMQNLWVFVSPIPGLEQRVFHQAAPLWAILLPAVAFIGLTLWQQRRRRVLWLLAAPLAAAFHLAVPHVARLEIALGLLACLCSLAVLTDDSWAVSSGSIESRRGR